MLFIPALSLIWYLQFHNMFPRWGSNFLCQKAVWLQQVCDFWLVKIFHVMKQNLTYFYIHRVKSLGPHFSIKLPITIGNMKHLSAYLAEWNGLEEQQLLPNQWAQTDFPWSLISSHMTRLSQYIHLLFFLPTPSQSTLRLDLAPWLHKRGQQLKVSIWVLYYSAY